MNSDLTYGLITLAKALTRLVEAQAKAQEYANRRSGATR